MNKQFTFNSYLFSIGLIWLFHISGILGIIYGDTQWFIKATPINLGLSFLLVLWQGKKTKNFLLVCLLCFVTGMGAEWLGVQYGLIFGDYTYGAMLGPKLDGVPWLIGANWMILVACTGRIAKELTQLLWVRAILGTALMLFLDILIEPIAPILDFWEFESGVAPYQNYFGWAAVAFPLQLVFHYTKVELKGWFFHNLYLLQLLFFMILLLRLNSLPSL